MTPQEFDERLDAALENYANFKAWESKQDWREGYDRDANIANSRGIAKQALTSLIKELVAEAKPEYGAMGGEIQRIRNGGRNIAIDQFEQSLLKALEEV